MSSITHGCTARARLSERFSIQPSRRRWQFAHAALLGMLASGALAAEHDHAAHGEPGDSVELAPMVITGVAQRAWLERRCDSEHGTRFKHRQSLVP